MYGIELQALGFGVYELCLVVAFCLNPKLTFEVSRLVFLEKWHTCLMSDRSLQVSGPRKPFEKFNPAVNGRLPGPTRLW